MDKIFKALSDPTRRRILQLLRERDMTAGELADRFTLGKSTLSAHFQVLRDAELVTSTSPAPASPTGSTCRCWKKRCWALPTCSAWPTAAAGRHPRARVARPPMAETLARHAQQGLLLANAAVGAWAWARLPADAQVPIHFGLDGQADAWAARCPACCGCPHGRCCSTACAGSCRAWIRAATTCGNPRGRWMRSG
jgi:hypothetical protein